MNAIPPPVARAAQLGPFQDLMVRLMVERIETAFAEIAARHGVDEADLRAWVAWTAMNPADDAGAEVRR